MTFIDNTPDKWINFVLQNGWRLQAEVNEETGDLGIIVSNEKGNVGYENADYPEVEKVKELYKLRINEESK